MIDIEKQYDDIYIKYYHVILDFITSDKVKRYVAEDVAGETFTRLWKKRKSLKFNNPDQIINEHSLRSWLYKTATNVLHEYRRKNPAESSLDDLTDVSLHEDNIQDCIEDIRYKEYIEKIERILTPSELIIFRMIFIRYLSYDEVQERLKMNGSTLRSIVSRMRKKLKPYIDELIDPDK